MFDFLYQQPREEQDADARRLSLAQLTPDQRLAHGAITGGELAGQGLGEALGAATGTDIRSPQQKRREAAARVLEKTKGMNPSDPQYLTQLAAALQAEGMADEALAVQGKANEQALAGEKLVLEKQKATSLADYRVGQIDVANARLGASAPEVVKLQKHLENVTDPAQRAAIMSRMNALGVKGNLKFNDLGDRVQTVDANTGAVLRTDTVGAAPETGTAKAKREAKEGNRQGAYDTMMQGLQTRYDAVAQLFAHPGVGGMTGALGSLIGEAGDKGGMTKIGLAGQVVSSDATRGAIELHKQVVGGTFLAGLEKLKSASKTGSTGLGAVSEREGDKVQSDAAALGRSQSENEFRQRLAEYASRMEASADIIAQDGASHGVTVTPLQKRALTLPARGAKRAAPAPAAAPAPSAPAAGKWKVREL